jgi:hypothetical protein
MVLLAKKVKKLNFDQRKILLSLFLLVILPVTLLAVFQIKKLFSGAAGFTYKVVKNHQKTCGEQVEWGNHIIIKVVD